MDLSFETRLGFSDAGKVARHRADDVSQVVFDLPFRDPDELSQLPGGAEGSGDQLHNALPGREIQGRHTSPIFLLGPAPFGE